MKKQKRPKIPREIARSVRRKCGFGCVICGFPIYEYDHVEGWVNTRSHQENQIVLLCPTHHAEKTRGLLTIVDVQKARRDPFNLQSGTSSPYELKYSGNEYFFDIGTNKIFGQLTENNLFAQLVRVDDQILLGVRLEDGRFLITMTLCDNQGHEVLRIKDNALMYNVQTWDVEFVGKRLKIREQSKQIIVDIEFGSPSKVFVRRGRFLRNGVDVLVTEKWAAVLNNTTLLQGNHLENGTIGLAIGNDPMYGAAIALSGVPREGWDRDGAIIWAQKQASDLSEDIHELAWINL